MTDAKENKQHKHKAQTHLMNKQTLNSLLAAAGVRRADGFFPVGFGLKCSSDKLLQAAIHQAVLYMDHGVMQYALSPLSRGFFVSFSHSHVCFVLFVVVYTSITR